LNFPLLADNELKASKAFGTLSPTGKTAQRMTFVINKEGNIAKIYTKVSPATHPQEVLEFVKGLKK
jgi:peroxiredoxin Q/BCP